MKIFLIGLMGAGKSTIGELVAQQLALPFYDTDKLIEQRLNKSINLVFTNFGEQYFRKIESEILAQLTLLTDGVIATGGGIIECENNRELLQKEFAIYLETSVTSAMQRLANDSQRPLINVADKQQKLTELLFKREVYYKSSASLIVNTDGKTPEILSDEIIAELR